MAHQLVRYLPQGVLTYPVKLKRSSEIRHLEEGDVLTVERVEGANKKGVTNPPPMTAVDSRYFGHRTLFAGVVYSGQRLTSMLGNIDLAAPMPTPIVMGICNLMVLGTRIRAFSRLIPGPLDKNSVPRWRREANGKPVTNTQVTLYEASPMVWRSTREELERIAQDADLRNLFTDECKTCTWTRIPLYVVADLAGEGIDTVKPPADAPDYLTNEWKQVRTFNRDEMLEVYFQMQRQVDCKALTDAAPGCFCKIIVRQ